jgi:hypothetical protein
LYPAIKETPGYAVGQYTSVCPPLVGIAFDYGRDCAEVEAVVLERIGSTRPDVIVLSANWRKHRRYLQNLGTTIERLKAVSKGSQILVIGNVPQWEPSLPEILARSRRTLQRDLQLYTPLLDELRTIDQVLKAAAALYKVTWIAPIDLLCSNKRCLVAIPSRNGYEPIAYDYGHLTSGGAKFLLGAARFLQ